MPDRFLITIGAPQTPGLKPLTKVEADIRRIKAFFTGASQGYTPVLEDTLPIGASSAEVKKQLEQWFAVSRNEEDLVVIYIAGHGDISYGAYEDPALLFADTDSNLPSSVIRTSELFRLIFDGRNLRPQNILLILDVCHGGALANEGIAELAGKKVKRSKAGKGLYVIGAATQNSLAEDGQFVEGWMNVYADEAWEPAGEYWHIDSLVGGINARFEALKKRLQRADYYVNGGTGIPQFIKARKRGAIKSYEVANLSYWEIKARGIDTAGMHDWFFTGREHALQEIATWLQATDATYNCCFVTGDPGSGKSALLGRLLLSVLPETRAALLTGLGLNEHDPTIPATGIIKVYFNAKGAYLRDLIAAIALQLEVDANTTDALLQVLINMKATTGMIVDSLDEAVEPTAILSLLESLATASSVRLIIGCRRGNLLATWQGRKNVIDLDQSPYFSSTDIKKYVAIRLQRFAPNAAEGAIEKLCARIADAAQRSFLYARVVSRYLSDNIHRPEDWADVIELPISIVAAFGQDLQRFEPAQRQMLIDLLTPLAYAGGKGIPQKTIWATLASYCSGATYTNSHIRELKEIAGYYLIKDTDEEEVVYRLFHQTFADYIRNQTADEAVEEKITEGLQSMMKTDGNGKASWKYTTEPYLRKHFATHAAHAGMLDRYLDDLDFMLHYPPESVLPVIASLRTDNGKKTGKAYRRASHWLREGPSIFLSQLTLRAQEFGASGLVNQIRQSPLPQEWKVGWGKWDNAFAYFVVVNAPEPIVRFVTYEDIIFGPLVVCTHDDNSIRVWRLTEGRLLHEFPADPTQKGVSITYLSVCRHGDYLYIAIAYYNKTVVVYKLGEIDSLARTKFDGEIDAMLLGQVDDQLMLILSTREEDGPASILFFSAIDLAAAGIIKGAALNAIYSLTIEEMDGMPVLIAGGDHLKGKRGIETRPVKIWSLFNRTLLWECPEVKFGTFRYVYSFHYQGDLWIIVFSSISRVGYLYDVAGKRTLILGESWFVLDSLMGFSVKDDRLEMLGRRNSEAHLLTVDLDAPQLQYRQQKLQIGFVSDQWAQPVTFFDRLTLIDKDGRQVRIWDFEEAMEIAAQSGEQSSAPVYKKISGSAKLLAGATWNGRLTVWDTGGNQLAEQKVSDIVNIQLSGTEKESILVVLTENMEIHLFSAASLSHRKTIAVQGVQARDLYVFGHGDRWLALVLVEIKYNTEEQYIARLIDLHTGMEVPYQDGFWHDHRFHLPGYEQKTLQTAAFIQGPVPYVVLAGPYGVIRAVGLNELVEDYEWKLENYNYVTTLVTFEDEGKNILMAGDDSGFMGSFALVANESFDLAKVKAHMGRINALLVHTTPKGTIVLSASEDGFIHFWTKELVCRYSIHIEHNITDLTLTGNDTIAVACSKGLVTIQPDWDTIIPT